MVWPSDKLLTAHHKQNGIKPEQPDQSTATNIVYSPRNDLRTTSRTQSSSSIQQALIIFRAGGETADLIWKKPASKYPDRISTSPVNENASESGLHEMCWAPRLTPFRVNRFSNIQNAAGSGILSVYTVLREGAKCIYCGLTNHHMVRPSDEVLEAPHKQNGIKIGQIDQATAILMSYPCHDDLRLTVKSAESDLNRYQRQLVEVQNQINDGLDP